MSDVSVTFSAQIGQLVSGIGQVKREIESIGGSIEKITGTFGAFGEVFAGAFLGAKISSTISEFAGIGNAVTETAQSLGLTQQQVQTLGVAEALAGEQTGSLSRQFVMLSRNIENARNPTSQQAAALRALGLSSQQLLALPMEQAFETVSVALEKYHGGVTKNALASALFGRGLAELQPVIKQAATNFEEATAVGERTGAVFSGPLIATFTGLHKQIVELGLAFKGLGGTLVGAFSGAISGTLKVMTDLVERMTASYKAGGSMKVAIDAVAIAAGGLASALAVSVAAIETLWNVGKAAFEALAVDVNSFGRMLYDAFTGNFSDIKKAWADMLAANKQVAINAAADMETVEKSMVAELKAIWGSGAGAGAADHRPPPPDFTVNKDALGAQIKALNEQIQMQNQAYQSQVEQIDSAAKLFQIDEEEKTQALIIAVQTRVSAVESEIKQEIALYKGAGKDYSALTTELVKVAQKGGQDIIKIQDQATQEYVKEWTSVLTPIEGAFNSQLRGLLSGTETWSQAMKKIFADLVIVVIEDFEKIAVEKIALGLTGLTGGGTGGAAGGGLGGAAAGGLISVFGGLFGKILGGLVGFDTGAWSVPRDMPAMVHQGEAIIPNNGMADAFRAGQLGGGGSTSVIFAPNLSAFNPSGLQSLINAMMPQFSRALNSYQNLNPSAQ